MVSVLDISTDCLMSTLTASLGIVALSATLDKHQVFLCLKYFQRNKIDQIIIINGRLQSESLGLNKEVVFSVKSFGFNVMIEMSVFFTMLIVEPAQGGRQQQGR